MLTFDTPILCGQQFSISTRKCMFLRKCYSDRKWLDPIIESMPNALPYELLTQTFYCLIFWNTGSGNIRIHVCKVSMWNFKCARMQQHSFSTHERMLLRQCQRFGGRKYLDPGGFESPSFNSCRIFYYSCCQGQTFAMSRFGILALVVCIFCLKREHLKCQLSIAFSKCLLFLLLKVGFN